MDFKHVHAFSFSNLNIPLILLDKEKYPAPEPCNISFNRWDNVFDQIDENNRKTDIRREYIYILPLLWEITSAFGTGIIAAICLQLLIQYVSY